MNENILERLKNENFKFTDNYLVFAGVCKNLKSAIWLKNNGCLFAEYGYAFNEDVLFAKDTGLDKFYFWGVEWWYWMKTKQNQPQIWNEAKLLFK